jgi:threonyl-tRNA synthetase
VWLAPVQARVLPLTEKQLDYATEVFNALRGRDVRVEIDRRSEKIGAKIRDAQMQKIPYMVIVGAKEGVLCEDELIRGLRGKDGVVCLLSDPMTAREGQRVTEETVVWRHE